MRDLIYYVATTLDGFIAEEDGRFDRFPWDDGFGADLMANFPETFPFPMRDPSVSRADNRWFDVVLMGRKTYEVGLREGLTNPYPTMEQYVFSRSMEASPDPAVTLVRENAVEVVRNLKQQPGKAIWLCGGGSLATTFFASGLIDQLIVKQNPVLFGKGIPLFSGLAKTQDLDLIDHKIYPSGHLRLHFSLPSK